MKVHTQLLGLFECSLAVWSSFDNLLEKLIEHHVFDIKPVEIIRRQYTSELKV